MKRVSRRQRGLIASFIASTLAAAAYGPSVVWAQTAEANLRGHAAPGATITATNVATGASRRTTASANGSYTLAGMPPGTYRVNAGPGTTQTLTLSVASTETYDFVKSAVQTAALQQVVVTGTRLQDVRTSEVGEIVSLHDIDVVPQLTRNFLEFADTVPGMVFTVGANGDTSIRGGAEVDQNVNVYIDGVGMKDYISRGGVSGQDGASKAGDPGNPFPQAAIGEYKVITSNYSAQYDQVASAAISAVTKSGTNEFTGEAFGDFTNENMRADTPAEVASTSTINPKEGGATDEYGVDEGGPIIPNVMHFFIDYEHKNLSLPNSVFPPGQNGATLANLQTVLPASIYSQYGPTSNPFKEDLVFAKIDWEPSDNDRFELTDLTRVENQQVGAGGQVAASAAYAYKDNNERIMLLWQHAGNRWINEARFTYQNALDSPEQASETPASIYYYFASTSVNSEAIQVNGQQPESYFRYKQSGPGFQDDFTLSDLNWAGDHTLKMGVKFQSIDLQARDAQQGAEYYYAADSTGTYPTPFQAVFTLTNPGQDITANSSDKQYGVYFQDDWVPIHKLTVNLGVRWDYETVPSWQNFQLPASIVAALNSPYPTSATPAPRPGETYAQALALGGININDYIGNGHDRHPQSNEFQPRLGFSYDIQDDQRHVIFGGYARSYDRNVFDVMSLETTKLAISEPTIGFYGTPYTLNGCTTAANASPTCIAWNPAYLNLANLQAQEKSAFGEIDLTKNNLKNPYSDQFSLGIRNRLGDWDTSVAVAQINSYNGIMGHLGNRYANGAYYNNGTQWGSSGVPGMGNLILWDNAANDRNTELLVSADKPYTPESHWGATVAYTYTHALQNNPYSYESFNGYEFDLPSPSDYPYLPSSAVARHRLVITGSHDGPWGMLYAMKVTLATPTPIAAVEPCAIQSQCHGYNAYPVVGYVRDTLQEREVDVQATKNFDLMHSLSAYLRLDVLNVFNTPYYDPAGAIFSPVGGKSYPPPMYNTAGPILGVPLTLKITGGLKW
ncbi:MAG: TonB-dependent receptor domain-containing protein [Steroidobacteraceae bacterium]